MTTKAPEKESREIAVSFKAELGKDNVKKRFGEILGPRRGAQFISSLINVWTNSKSLQECEPESILGAAAQAAALDLSIVPTIGHAAIVPYKTKAGHLAQFQIMTRGIIQLAHRTGKYKRMNLAEVYEGQLIKYDEFTGLAVLDAGKKKSDKVIGFYFTFSLVNGYLHEAYWPVSRCLAHGLRYSKSFQYGSGLWTEDPNIPKLKDGGVDFKALKALIAENKAVVSFGSGACAMCGKTIIKNTITKWGPQSSDMQDAFTADQAVITPDGGLKYIDATGENEQQALDGPMPKRASDKAKEEKEAETKAPSQMKATGTLVRVAKTTMGDKPVDVATIEADGKELKFYSSVKEIGDALQSYIGKSVTMSADVIADKNWLVEFQPA